jgi:putative hydrolase of the HAD superfamily
MIRAVTFDFWDTMLSEARGEIARQRVDHWLELLGSQGTLVDRASLDEAFAEAWAELERRWVGNLGQFTPVDATAWICERLGISPDGIRDDLIDSFGLAGSEADLRTAPGLGEVLEALATAGLRLGIVCDVGFTPSATLRARLERLGLLGRFDSWSFSDETGWFKPAPGAFEPALSALGVDPREAAHVGDTPRTDVAGARALGMVTVRYTGFADRRANGEADADFLAGSLAEIPELLGI